MKVNSESFKTTGHIKTNIRLLKDVQEYIDVIEYLRHDFNTSPLWHRGVSHAKYELIPRVYRDRLWERHENYEWWIFTSFVNRARSFIPDHSNYTQWNWYFTMQHYGLPTRLLDWTEGSLIALYFAVRNPKNIYIPSVYVLDPYWFDEVVNDQKKGEGLVYNTDPAAISEEHNKLLSSYLESDSECPCFPLCLQPPATDLRITAQRSVFTIHGVYINAFRLVARNNDEPHMAKIRFSTKYAEYIKDQLFAMGITESTLFPELEGLSRDLKWDFGIE